jgi:hypothetical protein
MSVRETEKTSGNRRLKENRQLQSQMIGHGVKGTFEAAGGGSVAVGAILRPQLRCGSGDVVCQQQLKSCTRDGRAWRVMPTR